MKYLIIGLLLSQAILPCLPEARGQAADTGWGVVSPGVQYTVTPGGFKEPPGPGEGAGLTYSGFRIEVRGTPGSDVTVRLVLPDNFVSGDSTNFLPLAYWTFGIEDDWWWGGGPVASDSVRLTIGGAGTTILLLGASLTVPVEAMAGPYVCAVAASFPGSPIANPRSAGDDGESGVVSDTVVYRHLQVVPLTGVVRPHGPVADFRLHPNYPNPFNPVTTISFDLPEAVHASVRVYDALGREVAVLFDGMQRPGNHSVTFDAAGFPSGVYACRVTAGAFSDVRKMVLAK